MYNYSKIIVIILMINTIIISMEISSQEASWQQELASFQQQLVQNKPLLYKTVSTNELVNLLQKEIFIPKPNYQELVQIARNANQPIATKMMKWQTTQNISRFNMILKEYETRKDSDPYLVQLFKQNIQNPNSSITICQNYINQQSDIQGKYNALISIIITISYITNAEKQILIEKLNSLETLNNDQRYLLAKLHILLSFFSFDGINNQAKPLPGKQFPLDAYFINGATLLHLMSYECLIDVSDKKETIGNITFENKIVLYPLEYFIEKGSSLTALNNSGLDPFNMLILLTREIQVKKTVAQLFADIKLSAIGSAIIMSAIIALFNRSFLKGFREQLLFIAWISMLSFIFHNKFKKTSTEAALVHTYKSTEFNNLVNFLNKLKNKHSVTINTALLTAANNQITSYSIITKQPPSLANQYVLQSYIERFFDYTMIKARGIFLLQNVAGNTVLLPWWARLYNWVTR